MKNTKPYVIAEMGVNFYDTAKVLNISPLEAAKMYIDGAAEAGCDCAKFQSYKADTIVSKNSPAYWDLSKEPTKTQHALFMKHDGFNEEDYRELCNYTHERGMDFTSTPFDYASADYLEDMVDFYKISSSDLSNLPFIRHIAKKGKKMIVSVGAAYISEVDEAVRAMQEVGNNDIVILHCVLSYPTDPKNANLRIIETLKISLIVSVVLMLIGLLLFMFIPRQLLSMFSASENMMSLGVVTLRIMSLGFLFSAISFIISAMYESIGKGTYSLVISLVRQCIIIIPVSMFFYKIIGLTGIWITFPVSEIAAALVCLWMFIRTCKKDEVFIKNND